MERLEGETLASVIARGALPLASRARAIPRACCRGRCASRQGARPSRSQAGERVRRRRRHAVLLDFGIAKDIDAPASTTTQEGNVRGTPAYMAPSDSSARPRASRPNLRARAGALHDARWALAVGRSRRIPKRDSRRDRYRSARAEALDVEIRRALSTRAQNRPSSARSAARGDRAASADATEPEAAETARLRPGAPSGEQQGASPHRTPGGPEQHTTTCVGPTAQASPHQSRRSRTSRGIASAGVAVLAAGIVTWRLRAHDARKHSSAPAPNVAAVPVSQPANDPWNAPAVVRAHEGACRSSSRSLSAETYRAEAAAAIARLPRTRGSCSRSSSASCARTTRRRPCSTRSRRIRVGRADERDPAVRTAIDRSDAEWIVFGAPALKQSRSTARSCCAAAGSAAMSMRASPRATSRRTRPNDGAKLYRIGDYGWLDFIDDHTAFVTIELRARTPRRSTRSSSTVGAPPQHVRDLLAKLPVDRAFAMVADGAAKDDWAKRRLTIPTGSDLYGWIRVERARARDRPRRRSRTPQAAPRSRQSTDFENLVGTGQDGPGDPRQGTAVQSAGTVNDLLIGITLQRPLSQIDCAAMSRPLDRRDRRWNRLRQDHGRAQARGGDAGGPLRDDRARRVLPRPGAPAARGARERSTTTTRRRSRASLLAEHLRELRAGRAVDVPIYDFATHTRAHRDAPRRAGAASSSSRASSCSPRPRCASRWTSRSSSTPTPTSG